MQSISPLRYPGGKSKLFDEVKTLITADQVQEYAEPFAGGFGLGLLLLTKRLVNKVYLNDLDFNIASFWKCLVKDHYYFNRELKRIKTFTSIDQWLAEREKQLFVLKHQKRGYKKRAWATLFLNRVNRSGILNVGPIGGKKQDGNYPINSRFNPERLRQQIKLIAKYRKQIIVSNQDYQPFVNNLPTDVFIFFDPPYVSQAKRLYRHAFNISDHIKLENFLSKLQNPWVVTYDQQPLIKKLYANPDYSVQTFNLNYHAGKFKVGYEFLITQNNYL